MRPASRWWLVHGLANLDALQLDISTSAATKAICAAPETVSKLDYRRTTPAATFSILIDEQPRVRHDARTTHSPQQPLLPQSRRLGVVAARCFELETRVAATTPGLAVDLNSAFVSQKLVTSTSNAIRVFVQGSVILPPPRILCYDMHMTINLADSLEQQVRSLAAAQGRDIQAVIEEAVRDYLVSAAITDVEPDDLAQSQLAMLPELANTPEWQHQAEEDSR